MVETPRPWYAGTAAVLVATLAVVLLCHRFGERWHEHDGYGGGDGVVYGNLAQDFYFHAVTVKLTPYTMQRVVPSLLIHHALPALGLPRDARHIGDAFVVLGVLLSLAVALAWCRIAAALRISPSGLWLGWTALLVNYAGLKWQHFSPVLTDMAGFALGAWLLVAYLERRTLTLVLLSLVGAFTWPTCLVLGAIFLLFPRQDEAPSEPVSAPLRIGLAVAVAALAGWYVYRVTLRPIVFDETFLEPGVEIQMKKALGLSVALAAGYLGLGVFALLGVGRLLTFEYLASPRWWLRAALVVGLVVGVQLTQAALTRHDEAVPTPTILLRQTAYASTIFPAFFLVAHVAFFGMAYLLVVRFWPDACREMGRLGRAVPLALGLALVLSLNSQSRFCFSFFPVAVAFAVKAADSYRWDRRQLVAFALAALALSKVWYPIHSTPPPLMADALIALGPWMTRTAYWVQAVTGLALAVGFCLAWSRLPRVEVAVPLSGEPLRRAG